MFIYEANNKVNIVLDGNKPAALPDYTIDLVDQELFVNDTLIEALTKTPSESDSKAETPGSEIA